MSEATQPVAAGMPCPRCRVELMMSDRQGIGIDYCPKCRGVWLDRGELDKIIERDAQFSTQAAPPSAPAPSPWTAPSGPPQQGWAPGYDPYQQGGHHDRQGRGHHGRGHGSFLGRLFD